MSESNVPAESADVVALERTSSSITPPAPVAAGPAQGGPATVTTLPTPATAEHDALVHALRAAIGQTPGVVRLEPTLATGGLRSLCRPDETDGIRVASRQHLVDVDVNVAVDRTHQARAVARRIRGLISEIVAERQVTLGHATVSVLSIE